MEKLITVVSVSWYSSAHLKRLITNLLAKAEQAESLSFLIVDNADGADTELDGALADVPSVRIVQNDPQSSQRSIAHASALDSAMPQLDTPFIVVIDPDVHVFREGWDRICQNEIDSGNVAVGAPYPQWKLGKVHDFPSVVFCFGRADWFMEQDEGWYPFPSSVRWASNFFVRKIVRLFGFATRTRLESSGMMRKLTGGLEKMTGITSPDTGWRFAQAAKEESVDCTVFHAPYASELEGDEAELARDFELFYHSGIPFMSHMYSSGIAYYRTEKSGDLDAWLSVVEKVEKGLS